MQQQPHLVSELIRNGADVNAKTPWDETPLHCAAITGNAKIVTMLIDAGADPHAVNRVMLTPSNLAANAGHWHIADNILRLKSCGKKHKQSKDPPQIGG